ncbi:MAG TPA: DUF1289 domain-containing protein [Burkholderiales bacterium]|nr:DUF1289 domain-containing protein [Burkholderiales bacterium]
MDLLGAEEGAVLQGRPSDHREEKALKSPCTKLCVMDPQSGLCRGCLRTLAEIAGWSEMPESEQETLTAALAERRDRLDVPEIPVPPLA